MDDMRVRTRRTPQKHGRRGYDTVTTTTLQEENKEHVSLIINTGRNQSGLWFNNFDRRTGEERRNAN